MMQAIALAWQHFRVSTGTVKRRCRLGLQHVTGVFQNNGDSRFGAMQKRSFSMPSPSSSGVFGCMKVESVVRIAHRNEVTY